jgi:hypothetical protein
MNEKRRAEIKIIVDRFRGTAITQNAIDEFCNLNHVETVMAGELSDWIAQVEYDEKIAFLFPLILKELQGIQYQNEFDTEVKRNAVKKLNDEVRVNIVKLLEEHAVEYRYVTKMTEELGGILNHVVTSAGTTAFNKSLEVLMYLARKEFGGEMTLKHARDFAADVFKKAEIDKNKGKA